LFAKEYYQLEELEDKDTCTTELFLRADGVIEFGDTDGPVFTDAIGRWAVPEGTNTYGMIIKRTFQAGASDGTDMGEFSFERKYAAAAVTLFRRTKLFSQQVYLGRETTAVSRLNESETDRPVMCLSFQQLK